jgi:hypothetical protein
VIDITIFPPTSVVAEFPNLAEFVLGKCHENGLAGTEFDIDNLALVDAFREHWLYRVSLMVCHISQPETEHVDFSLGN